jgi:hypothetical protein
MSMQDRKKLNDHQLTLNWHSPNSWRCPSKALAEVPAMVWVLSQWAGQGSRQAWADQTNPIPSGSPYPAPG